MAIDRLETKQEGKIDNERRLRNLVHSGCNGILAELEIFRVGLREEVLETQRIHL